MKRSIYIILGILLLLALFSGCAKNETAKMATIDDLTDKRIGVYTGTIYDKFAVKRFPDATIMHYNSISDFVLALKSNKINAAITNLYSAKNVTKTNPEIGILTDDVLSFPIGIGFNKNNPTLRERFNVFLKQFKADGSFDKVYRKWFSGDPETVKIPDFEPNPGGDKVVLGVSVGDLPNVGYISGKYVGFDVELVQTFARKEKLNLEIITMEFGGLIAALAAGKVDMIADCIAINEERKAQIDFSDPYMEDKSAVIALKENLANAAPDEFFGVKKVTEPVWGSFWHSVAKSFYSNIILENRYVLILDGLKTTAIISIFAVIFGTFLGALICFLRMSRCKAAALLGRVYISLLRGLPVLVLLMLIFYVVFAKININPVLVAVIAFGMNFAAYVAEMFRSGITSIDKGQTEAGIAGGFTKTQTFIYIVMPQAVRQVLPVYKGELISLVKSTSIVGYIAVQDLTKASDIIRSRTFDAFFPLMMTAILYFLICGLLLLVLNAIERKTDPKRKRDSNSGSNRTALVVSLTLAALIVIGFSVPTAIHKNVVNNGPITTLAQLDGKRICVITGTTGDFAVRARYKKAQVLDMVYPADAALALQTQKADAFVFDKSTLQYMIAKNKEEFTILPEKLAEVEIAIPMQKDDVELHQLINAGITKLKNDGTLDKMYRKWFIQVNEKTPEMPDIALDGRNGTLCMGTCLIQEPFSFSSNGKMVGFDIELGYRLAEMLGVKLVITDMSYDAMMAALQTKKIDLCIANYYKLKERESNVKFSIPYMKNEISALVRREK